MKRKSKAPERDTSGEPYDPTSPASIAAHAEARRNRTGCYAPSASDDPDRVAPIAPQPRCKSNTARGSGVVRCSRDAHFDGSPCDFSEGAQ
jgi:hypothetical protein